MGKQPVIAAGTTRTARKRGDSGAAAATLRQGWPATAASMQQVLRPCTARLIGSTEKRIRVS
eukprot:7908989-Lingulodinium_polyedra.AAC.1